MKILPSGSLDYHVSSHTETKKRKTEKQKPEFENTSRTLEKLSRPVSKSFKENRKRSPEAPKNDPRKLPRPEMQQEESRKGLQGAAWDPQGAPEAQQAFFDSSKAFFGSTLATLLGSTGGAQIVLFDMNRLHWPPKSSIENQKIFYQFSMTTCKNHCFFNAKPLSTPARRPPQEGP